MRRVGIEAHQAGDGRPVVKRRGFWRRSKGCSGAERSLRSVVVVDVRRGCR
jgi:hypothetical protein